MLKISLLNEDRRPSTSEKHFQVPPQTTGTIYNLWGKGGVRSLFLDFFKASSDKEEAWGATGSYNLHYWSNTQLTQENSQGKLSKLVEKSIRSYNRDSTRPCMISLCDWKHDHIQHVRNCGITTAATKLRAEDWGCHSFRSPASRFNHRLSQIS